MALRNPNRTNGIAAQQVNGTSLLPQHYMPSRGAQSLPSLDPRFHNNQTSWYGKAMTGPLILSERGPALWFVYTVGVFAILGAISEIVGLIIGLVRGR